MILKDSKIKRLTKGEAKDILTNVVFNSSILLERLEILGKLNTNGYELRLKLRDLAESLIEEHWTENDN